MTWSAIGTLTACSRGTDEARTEAFSSQPHVLATPQFFECARMVDGYVASRRGWKTSDYRIELVQQESALTPFRVLHADDSHRSASGKGLSFTVEADCAGNKVLRETGMNRKP